MVTSRTASCLVGGLLGVLLIPVGAALAFPFIDPSNQDSVPTGAPLGTELPAPDVSGLRNQLRLTNPLPAGNASAWTIIPRLTLQELFTDNVLEVQSPRRFDAITVVAPGISIVADTSRLKLNLDYQPNLILHAVDGPLNVITQQLNATGLITVIPDLAFVDVRALAGVQSSNGLTGYGTIGNANAAIAPVQSNGITTSGQSGLNPLNETQTASVGISPYLLHQFKDYGTGKIGVSVDYSRYNSIDGFLASPFPSGSQNSQSLLTTEQIAQFTTGEFLGRFQDTFSVDLLQSQSKASNGATVPVITAQGLVSNLPATSFSSDRQTVNDQLTFAMNRYVSLLGSLGYQDIRYSNNVGPQFNGLIWSVGFTLTPSPLSSVTVSYGYQNGADAFNASGYLAVGGQTQINFNYSNTVGTQLENLQNQLNNSAVNANGQLVNVQTAGANFTAANALGVQNGVFRFSTFNAGVTTTWLRDTLQANATWSVQTNLTPGAVQSGLFFDQATQTFIQVNQPATGTSQSTDLKTIALTWTHLLSADLTLASSASYTYITQSGGLGNQNSVAAAVGLQYALSESTSLSARYSFFDRTSNIPGYSTYENVVLLSVTKKF